MFGQHPVSLILDLSTIPSIHEHFHLKHKDQCHWKIHRIKFFYIPDTELSTEGGLQIVGWLEGPTGIISCQRTKENAKNLAFAVSLGSTYELVSAVYGRGRMLARLQNFTFQCPQDTKKQMKKYGQNIPLSAFISQSLFQKFSSDQGSQLKNE